MVILYGYTSSYSLAEPLSIVGREQELNTIQSSLNTENGFVHLCGLPGIGKTSIVKKYLHLYQEQYDYALWLNNNSQITDQIRDFLAKISTRPGDSQPYKLELLKSDTAFDYLLGYIQKSKGRWLIIVDDADEEMIHKIHKSATCPNHYIVISRSIYNKSSIKIMPLTRSDSISLLSLGLSSHPVNELDELASYAADYPLALVQARMLIQDIPGLTISHYISNIKQNSPVISQLYQHVVLENKAYESAPESLENILWNSLEDIKRHHIKAYDLLINLVYLDINNISEQIINDIAQGYHPSLSSEYEVYKALLFLKKRLLLEPLEVENKKLFKINEQLKKVIEKHIDKSVEQNILENWLIFFGKIINKDCIQIMNIINNQPELISCLGKVIDKHMDISVATIEPQTLFKVFTNYLFCIHYFFYQFDKAEKIIAYLEEQIPEVKNNTFFKKLNLKELDLYQYRYVSLKANLFSDDNNDYIIDQTEKVVEGLKSLLNDLPEACGDLMISLYNNLFFYKHVNGQSYSLLKLFEDKLITGHINFNSITKIYYLAAYNIELIQTGNFKHALLIADEALELVEQDCYFFSAQLHEHLSRADCLVRLKRHAEALQILKNLEENLREIKGSKVANEYNLAHLYLTMARCYFGLKDYAQALSYLQIVIKDENQQYSFKMIKARAYELQGDIDEFQGHFNGALLNYQKSVNIYEDIFKFNEHYDYANVSAKIVFLHFTMGQNLQALSSLDDLINKFTPAHIVIAELQNRLYNAGFSDF